MIPIIAFVGEKKSGKTLVLEKVIRELRKRGKRVGVLKHTHHKFQLDYPKTDTSRLSRAGAQIVAIASENELGLYGKPGFELEPEIVRDLFFPAVDVILVEGYKSSPLPKILVALKGALPAWAKDLGGLIAIISRQKQKELVSEPVKFFKPGQIREIADLVESYIKLHRPKREVKIYLDGKNLQIKPFIKDFFLNTVSAMVGSLKGTAGATRIQLTIDLPKGKGLREASKKS